METVRPICADVAHRGAEALRELGERLDGIARLAPGAWPGAWRRPWTGSTPMCARPLRNRSDALGWCTPTSADRTSPPPAAGGTVTERRMPVARVGLYVPGGLAVILLRGHERRARPGGRGRLARGREPATKGAGPFQGLPHPSILAAAAMLGVEEVYAVGGAQAIAMFAYGAAEADGTVVCPRVDLVTGPGNIYVAAAKRLLRGRVGIDAEAGPTEIAILADETADPAPCRCRPDQPGRARHHRGRGARDRQRGTRGRRRARGSRAGGGDQAHRADPYGPFGCPVRDCAR